MDTATLNAYETRAAEFAARYGAADLAPLHRLLLAHLPPAGRLLEIGCGTGREAAFLAEHGFTVIATDASAAMLDQVRRAEGSGFVAQSEPNLCRELCRELCRNEDEDERQGRRFQDSGEPLAAQTSAFGVERSAFSVRFLQAAFPLPAGHPLLADRFDAILALAVVMHLPDADLFEFAFQLRAMLKPGGTVVLSLSEGHAVSAESRAADGRLFRERSPTEVTLLFERLGFRLVVREQESDSLGRDTLRWTTLVLRLDTSGSRPVDQIETIINHDKKDATYKLALLRALCDIAQTAYRHVRWHEDGTVSVPLGLVAEKWLYYYWPLIDTGDEPIIPQKRGMEVNTPIAFRKDLAALAAHYRGQNGLSRFHGEFQGGRLDPDARALTDAALNQIANTIVVGPVTFASQGGFRFGAGKRTARNRCFTPQELYAALGQIHFDAAVWRELCLVGHWIGEAILLRWAELTVEISRRQVPLARVIEKLLTRPETEREVAAARGIYKGAADLSCVWTQVPLGDRRFDVDHAIPFTIWHNNDLWNLLPADARVNNAKRDRLVSRDTLARSRDAIITSWRITRAAMPARFDLELNRTLFGRNHAEKQWEAPAFSALVEAVETVAIQRGVERWDPQGEGTGLGVQGSRNFVASFGANFVDKAKAGDKESVLMERAPISTALQAPPHSEPETHDFADIRAEAFTRYLPLVGKLAAGVPFSGFDIADLDAAAGGRWVAVPEHLAGQKRFVVQIAGDSMAPELNVGDTVVFEYHRSPRAPDQIVIANLTESGISSDLTTEHAVKRLRQTPNHWIFHSTNPRYPDIRIARTNCAYPILGIMVGRL
jgi:SAM-dependent methyltransferase/SOS-response transcriptional repressor LexA